jgi:hypothetical protein
MTFLAENELSALYVPSNFLPRIHPAYAEVAMFLATQLNDEARHIEVFLRRRARGRRRPGRVVGDDVAIAALALELTDFTEAAFLLSVLGEGTFLDLLKYVERFAPDEATRVLAERARVGRDAPRPLRLAHVRHALGHDPSLYGRLEAAVRKRAATMASAAGVPRAARRRAHDPGRRRRRSARRPEGPRRLPRADGDDAPEPHEAARARRLLAEQAKTLSDLHTPNFM